MLGGGTRESDETVGKAQVIRSRCPCSPASGERAASPEKTLSEFYALVRGQYRVDGVLNGDNPVVFNFASVPGGVYSIRRFGPARRSLSSGERAGQRRAQPEIAVSIEDITIRVRSVEAPDITVPVVDKETRGSVAGVSSRSPSSS